MALKQEAVKRSLRFRVLAAPGEVCLLILGTVRQAFGTYTIGFALLALTSLLCFMLNQRAFLTTQRDEQM